jgi:hypothetical protein
VTEAKYLIDLAPLSAHSMFGVTVCGKNWFGSICWRVNANYFPWNGGWTPSPLHNFGLRNNPMGSYNPIVDLIGHPQLGGKTLLFLVDGLYGSDNAITAVLRFRSFGTNWTASVLASQDPVAIDSVVVDISRNEPLMASNITGQSVDNYLHEAAQAGSPPSGTFYDPGVTGTRLTVCKRPRESAVAVIPTFSPTSARWLSLAAIISRAPTTSTSEARRICRPSFIEFA